MFFFFFSNKDPIQIPQTLFPIQRYPIEFQTHFLDFLSFSHRISRETNRTDRKLTIASWSWSWRRRKFSWRYRQSKDIKDSNKHSSIDSKTRSPQNSHLCLSQKNPRERQKNKKKKCEGYEWGEWKWRNWGFNTVYVWTVSFGNPSKAMWFFILSL